MSHCISRQGPPGSISETPYEHAQLGSWGSFSRSRLGEDLFLGPSYSKCGPQMRNSSNKCGTRSWRDGSGEKVLTANP